MSISLFALMKVTAQTTRTESSKMQKIQTHSQGLKFQILSGIFLGGLIGANLLGSKITEIFGVAVSVGIFAYPLTFLVTDIIAEVEGRERSHELVMAGLIAQILVLGLVLLSIVLPPAGRYDANEAYRTVFSNSARIILGSLIAFIISQNFDIWAFHRLKQATRGRMLWLRNNASTIVSQLIDTIIFMFIAFYLVTPKFDVAFLISLIIPYWLFKIAMAVLDTPFVYLGARWLREGKERKP
jgi:hypothetical protein